MKKILSIIVVVLLIAFAAGCKAEPVEEITINVAVPSGHPTLSMVRMFKHNPSLGEGVTVNYESVTDPALMAGKVASGEADIAIVPSNLAINLYNRGIEITFAGVSIWGILYIVTTDPNINNWDDLKGETINMLGQGLTPDIITRYLMNDNDVTPDVDVTFNYVAGGQALAQLVIAAGETSITSLMPEPALSKVLMRNSNARIIIDLQEEWTEATGATDGIPQAALIISNDLIENHPDVVTAFLTEYEAAIDWLIANPEQAGAYAEELGLGLTAAIVVKSFNEGRGNFTFRTAQESREALMDYYRILLGVNPDLIGGALPDDKFFMS